MRIVSVNVNGIRSAAKKGFFDWMNRSDADVVCLQEVRANAEQLEALDGHHEGWHFALHEAEKPGYSGVAIYSRKKPKAIATGLKFPEFDSEGRYLEFQFDGLKVISLYLPSGSSGEVRQAAKYRFLDEFALHMDKLAKGKDDVVICGDWNIAHTPIDICNDKGNKRTSGFLPAERAWMTDVLTARGWTDAFRALYPDEEPQGYTWWSNRGKAYEKNVGWRIDYQIVTPGLAKSLEKSWVYKDEKFSDHAPLIVDYADA